MNFGKFLLALAFGACSFNISSSLAQITQPVQLQSGETRSATLTKNSPVLKSVARYDCYAINTTSKEEITVTLESSAFDPSIEIARGALCHASTLQYENDNINDATTTAQVSFKAAGGRYLVIVKSKSPEAMGSYRLKIGGAAQQAVAQTPSTNTQRRQQIMEMEIAKREAELAAVEAKRRAELAAYEAQQAEILASTPTYDDYYEEEYEAPPQRNPFMVFAETLNSELAKQQQAEQEFQQGLDRAIRQGEAEHRRRVAAQQNAETQQRKAEALRADAQQKAQAAERARIEAANIQKRAAENARLANDRATSSAMRNLNAGLKAQPVGGNNNSTSPSRASTKSDPHLCIGSPQQVRNPNCKDGTAFNITNSCQEPVDLRICIRTVKGQWDCGVRYGVRPGAVAGWPSCFGTSDVFFSARNSDSDIPLASPP